MTSEPPRKRMRPSAASAASRLDRLDVGDSAIEKASRPAGSDEANGESETAGADIDYRDQSFYEPVKFGEFVRPAIHTRSHG